MTDARDSILSLSDTSFGYRGRAVVHVDQLTLRRSGCIGIYGPNGSGKTTLVRGLCGLLSPMTGRVDRNGATRFGYIAQQRVTDDAWPMSGFDACAMHASSRRMFGWIGSDRARVMKSMQLLDVGHLARADFSSLSGGQQQRIRLAGALADEPSVLVLDEPTDGLDRLSREQLLKSIGEAVARGVSVVIISHEASDLFAVADTFVLLREPEQSGEPSHARLVSREGLTDGLSVRSG